MDEPQNPDVGLGGDLASESQGMSAPGTTSAVALADAIAARLVDQGLVPVERRAEVAEGLRSGRLSAATWRVLAEVTLDGAARGRGP